MGVTFTLSSTGAMDQVADLILPPFKPWDAMTGGNPLEVALKQCAIALAAYIDYNEVIAVNADEAKMATLTVRNLDDDLKSTLRVQAARHGQSMEEEVRSILRQALTPATPAMGLGQRLAKRFQAVAAELSIPPRSLPRTPLTWDESA